MAEAKILSMDIWLDEQNVVRQSREGLRAELGQTDSLEIRALLDTPANPQITELLFYDSQESKDAGPGNEIRDLTWTREATPAAWKKLGDSFRITESRDENGLTKAVTLTNIENEVPIDGETHLLYTVTFGGETLDPEIKNKAGSTPGSAEWVLAPIGQTSGAGTAREVPVPAETP